MRAAAAVVALASVAASTPTLQPGLWRITSAPQAATLDGRALKDLPYTPPPPETVCMTAVQAQDIAAWFAREAPPNCTYARRSIAGGRVDIAGSCPSATSGYPAGTVRFTGRWSPTLYRLRFETADSGENGRMGFTGTTTGERIGDCP